MYMLFLSWKGCTFSLICFQHPVFLKRNTTIQLLTVSSSEYRNCTFTQRWYELRFEMSFPLGLFLENMVLSFHFVQRELLFLHANTCVTNEYTICIQMSQWRLHTVINWVFFFLFISWNSGTKMKCLWCNWHFQFQFCHFRSWEDSAWSHWLLYSLAADSAWRNRQQKWYSTFLCNATN